MSKSGGFFFWSYNYSLGDICLTLTYISLFFFFLPYSIAAATIFGAVLWEIKLQWAGTPGWQDIRRKLWSTNFNNVIPYSVFSKFSEILILYLEEHLTDKNSKILLRNLTSTKSYLMWNSWWWSQVCLWPRGDHHGPHPDPCWVPTPPLSAAQLPLGWGFWGLGVETAHP